MNRRSWKSNRRSWKFKRRSWKIKADNWEEVAKEKGKRMAVKDAEGGKWLNKSIYVTAKGERMLCRGRGGECRTEIRQTLKGCTVRRTKRRKWLKTQERDYNFKCCATQEAKLCSSYFLTKEENISRPEAFSLERLIEKYWKSLGAVIMQPSASGNLLTLLLSKTVPAWAGHKYLNVRRTVPWERNVNFEGI